MTRIVMYIAEKFVLHIVDNLLYVEAHRRFRFASSSSRTSYTVIASLVSNCYSCPANTGHYLEYNELVRDSTVWRVLRFFFRRQQRFETVLFQLCFVVRTV